jgi:Putative Flp pilus-assembly TadE/G-like
MRSDPTKDGLPRKTNAVVERAANLVKRLLREKSGSYAAIFGLSAPFLIGGAGLATEGGLWMYERHAAQNAADTAALSVATAYAANPNSNLVTQADSVIKGYPFMTSADNLAVTVNHPPASGAYAGKSTAVEVLIKIQQSRLLSAIYSSNKVTIGGRAVALVGNGGNGCVLALSATASGAISAQGSTAVTLKNCGIYDNSNSSSGLSAGGSASVTALSASVVGGVTGTANFHTTNGITTGGLPINDPYFSVPLPTFSGCDQHNLTEKKTATLSPGVYCGGLQLNAGADVTLSPGTYIMDQGSLQIAGGATLTGSGVTFVFTSSTGSNFATATINGGAVVNLTAPTTGSMKGLVFFGDRRMPTSSTYKFNGGSGQVVGGAVYIPDGAIEYAGDTNSQANCTQLIGNTITFTGNSVLQLNCSGQGTSSLGTSFARLVE